MKKLLITPLLLLVVLLSYGQTPTTFILVRHAEKADDGTRNPPLNEMGEERAANLADILGEQEIAALYSTPYKRTQETLQPLADNMKLEVQDYNPNSKGEWLAELYKTHEGKTVVISGHSNTIPNLANALLGSETFQQFDEKEYSNLIIVVGTKVGEGKLVRLSY